MSGALVNFVAITEADDWRQESWTATADKAELLQTYAGWNASLQTLFSQATHVNKWALYDRDPLPKWTDGRITLLGDAAHPMLPYLAQGACMAIEDAAALGILFSPAYFDGNVEQALNIYNKVRLPRATKVQSSAAKAAYNINERIGFSNNKDLPFYKVEDPKNVLTIEEMNA